MENSVKQIITEGKTALGIELGSTRIKAVLIGEDHLPLASGISVWENRLEDGVWTYHLSDVWAGLQNAYANLIEEVKTKYGVQIAKIGSIGISAMMHGYLVFDNSGKQLSPFYTWRNTNTGEAAAALTEKFEFNIPLRWSIAHLYQAILDGREHVGQINFITTLAGYVHWKLTGQKVLGVGDASGVFPIDSSTGNYNTRMLQQFDTLISGKGYGWKLIDILPQVLSAGADAGCLTAEGAKLLDPSGHLNSGIPLCPPEGDAGTGMVATNSVAQRTGNVSAGTSIFAMIVLEKELSKVYSEIDMVTTPTGSPVAMVHCNNCTSDIDAWAQVFHEFLDELGLKTSKSAIYDAMYYSALKGDADCGGLLSYNYISGEPITGFAEGRSLFTRAENSRFSLANFTRNLLFSTMATLKIGMDILTEKENVKLDTLVGHGGLFKTPGVGQRLMAAALNVPVMVMESAGEGGSWGIALLAAYLNNKQPGETLEAYLANRVFSKADGSRIEPFEADKVGFAAYMKRYQEGLAIERAAVDHLQ